MKKHLYTSGEFASLFKINKKTLEYYRSIGLFQPQYQDENGYFKYSHHQIDTFYTILSLKKLHVSLQEIKEYIDNRCPDSLIHLLEDKKKEAEDQIYELQKTRNYLKETIDFTQKGLSYSNDIIIEECPTEFLLIAEEGKDITNRKYQIEFEEATFSPDTSCIGTLIDMEDESNHGIFIKLYKDHNISNHKKKKGFYAKQVHKGSHQTIHQTYKKMKKYIEEMGYQIGRYAYEEYLIDDLATNDQNNYKTLISIELITDKEIQ